MPNIVNRFEGDNIKTQHGGDGKEFYSPAGFAYAQERRFANKLAQGKTREVNGVAAAKISENVIKLETAANIQTMNRSNGGR